MQSSATRQGPLRSQFGLPSLYAKYQLVRIFWRSAFRTFDCSPTEAIHIESLILFFASFKIGKKKNQVNSKKEREREKKKKIKIKGTPSHYKMQISEHFIIRPEKKPVTAKVTFD